MAEWIKITDDNLPEFGKRVMVGWSASPLWEDGAVFDNGVYRAIDGDGWCWVSWFDGRQLEWCKENYPTHYQPWPEPPTE